MLCLLVAAAIAGQGASLALATGNAPSAAQVPTANVAPEGESTAAADPTEVIPPTDVPPTEIPPTEVPTEAPSETPLPSETPSPVPTETQAPSPTATPSATPSPSIAWSIADDLTCSAEASSVTSGGSIVYACTIGATIEATAAGNLPLNLVWEVGTSPGSADWSVEVRAAADPDAEWFAAGDGQPLKIADVFAAPDSPDPSTSSRTLAFDVRVSRAACVISEPAIEIRIDAALSADDPSVPVTATGSTTRGMTLAPDLASIPEPSIAFLGPVSFGQVSLPTGSQVSLQASSAVLQVDGLDRSCGMWTITVESGPLTTETGASLDPANMQLVSVNGQLAPGSPCGLDQPCLVMMIVAGPDSIPTLQIDLGFQVIIPADAPLGTLDAAITATISQGAEAP